MARAATKRGDDGFLQLTSKKNIASIGNAQPFHLACCDCHLVHDVEVIAYQVRGEIRLTIKIERNARATNARRKLKHV